MKTYHILNGDCLAEQLKQTTIQNEYIICRECLIEGEVNAPNLADFWKIRARFITENYGATSEDYFERTVREIEKLNTIPSNAEVCLWFENDLFCQANMWFIISLLVAQPTLKVFRIFPKINKLSDTWKGFGIATTETLEHAFQEKVLFQTSDIILGNNLWTAYKNHDFEKLTELSKIPSNCFQNLAEVCQSHIDRFPDNNSLGRPERVIKEIIDTKSADFEVVFAEFSNKEGIYGFGDLQVKSMLDRLEKNKFSFLIT